MNLEDRVRELEAEIDLLRRGGTAADVQMIRAIAQRARGFSFTSREMGRAATLNPELAAHIANALGRTWSIKSLGRRLQKLQGGIVENQRGDDRDGITWVIHWPLQVSGPQTRRDHGAQLRRA